MEGKSKIVSVVMLVITMVIGLALTPTVQESVNDVTGTGGNNLTGAAATLAGLIPLLYVVVMIALPLAGIYKVLN